MWEGTTSKRSEETIASAASISIKADVSFVSGSTAIATMQPNYGGGFSGKVTLIPLDGTVTTVTTGNIAVAVSMAQNRATEFYYSKARALWYPGAIGGAT